MQITSRGGRFISFEKNRVFKCYRFDFDPGQKLLSLANQVAFRNEVEILQTIGSHSNIVQFITHFEKWQDGMNLGVLVLERLANGSMERIVFSPDWIYSDHTIYRWCSNILKGLTYLHSINVIHADIKLSNLMLDSNFVAKIGDFDLSLLDEVSGRSEKTVGTDRTRAPELWIDNHVYFSGYLKSLCSLIMSFSSAYSDFFRWCFGQESYILIELSQKGKLEPPKFQFNHPLCDFITLCNIPSRIARPTSKIVFKFLLELIETESVNFMMRSFTPEVIGLNRQSAPPIPTGFDEDENAHRTNF